MGVPEGGPETPPGQKSNKTLIIVLVVVGVLLLLCCCVFILTPMIFGPSIEEIFEEIMRDLEGAAIYFLV
jgi:flagellar basal body-associated protein FliL